MKEFFKAHADACAVITVIVAATLWMKGGIADLDKRLAVLENIHIAEKLEDINNRLTVIETVMLCNKMMPSHITCKGEIK